MKTLLTLAIAAGLLLVGWALVGNNAMTLGALKPLSINQGGTSIATAPNDEQILIGDGSGKYIVDDIGNYVVGGGGGGSGLWATNTLSTLVRPVDTDDVIVIGDNATSASGYILEVDGDVLLNNNLVTTGTTTGANGFNVTDGCFAIDGVCVGGAADHGGLTGLSDNDHPQYFLLSSWFSTTSAPQLTTLANLSITESQISDLTHTTDTNLTEEEVEDFVGGMVTGNTETDIAVTYQDADGTLDFVVSGHYTDADVSTYLTGGTGITEAAGTVSFDCSEVEGAGINCTGESVTLDATGDWTGTFDGQQGTYYLDFTNLTVSNGEITPNMVHATGQTDEYCLTYEATGTTWEWQTCGAGGGGDISGWATTTSQVSGQLNLYPTNATDILNVGGSATTSSFVYIDPNVDELVLNGSNGTSTYIGGASGYEWLWGNYTGDYDFLFASSTGQLDGLADANKVWSADKGTNDIKIWQALSIVDELTVTGATSTYSDGINLLDGCFSINGACIGGTALTQEQVEDYAGGMWTGNTETGGTITYQDGDGTIDFVLDATGDWTGTLDGYEAAALLDDTNTNAATICTGTGNYLDGEGNCDALTTFPGFTDIDTDYGAETVTAAWSFTTATTSIAKLDVTSAIAIGADYLTDVTGTGLVVASGVLAVDQTANYAWTGQQDMGGATFLEIPNGANPTANDVGEIAHDTTDNQLILDDYVIRTDEKLYSFTLASSSLEFVSGGIVPVPLEKDGYSISEIHCYVDGGTSVVVNISDGTNDTESVTCLTTATSDTDVTTNDTFTAAELAEVQIGTVTGTPDYLTVAVFGTYTRE